MKTLSRCGAGCLKKEGRRVEGPVGNPQPSLHLLSPRDPATCSRGGAGLPRDPIAMAPAVTIRPAAPPLLTSDLPTPPTPSPKPWEGPPRPSGAPDTHGDAPASGHSVSEGRSRTSKVKAGPGRGGPTREGPPKPWIWKLEGEGGGEWRGPPLLPLPRERELGWDAEGGRRSANRVNPRWVAWYLTRH